MVGMETPNELMVVFSTTVSTGFSALQGPVNRVFGLMIALVVALTGIQWALSPNREVAAAGFAKLLLIGAFAYLINDWQALSESIQAGFIDLGLLAGGGELSRPDFLNPGAVLQTGWEIVRRLGETPAPLNSPLDVAGNLTDALVLGLAMLAIMLSFAILALQIVVTLLEFKIVTLGGLVLLPFGIWSKSAFLAERPLGFVAASGLKTLALAIVISGARSVFDQLQPSANPDLYEALAILCAAVLLAMLAIFIPNLAAALVTGGPSLGLGAAASAGLAAAGAGVMAGIGAASLGSAVARGASTIPRVFAAAAGPPTGPRSGPPAADPPPSPPSPVPAPGGGGPAARPSGRSPATGAPTTGASSSQPAASEQTGPSPQAPAKTPQTARRRTAREQALQAFLTANAGRSLLPGSDAVGTVSPKLDPEEP